MSDYTEYIIDRAVITATAGAFGLKTCDSRFINVNVINVNNDTSMTGLWRVYG
ncbi:hypothetical protein [Dickeya zeae]|uniref:hypothetical protein n=1 Tax=Dickeya zeae TaxID=204042 RepID=UPI00144358D2|nr:hypothetical protein [Dickeya zeae]